QTVWTRNVFHAVSSSPTSTPDNSPIRTRTSWTRVARFAAASATTASYSACTIEYSCMPASAARGKRRRALFEKGPKTFLEFVAVGAANQVLELDRQVM